jgi:hypothetical protein
MPESQEVLWADIYPVHMPRPRTPDLQRHAIRLMARARL